MTAHHRCVRLCQSQKGNATLRLGQHAFKSCRDGSRADGGPPSGGIKSSPDPHRDRIISPPGDGHSIGGDSLASGDQPEASRDDIQRRGSLMCGAARKGGAPPAIEILCGDNPFERLEPRKPCSFQGTLRRNRQRNCARLRRRFECFATRTGGDNCGNCCRPTTGRTLSMWLSPICISSS